MSPEDFVVVKGERWNVERVGTIVALDIDFKIRDIAEIEGFERVTDLNCLNLTGNEITKISGLDNLVNLVHLDLSDNKVQEISGLSNLRKLDTLYLDYNQISELKGLEHLDKLRCVELIDNNIPLEVLEQVETKTPYSGPVGENAIDPKKAIEYCRKNVKK